jgi:hypothetical protein
MAPLATKIKRGIVNTVEQEEKRIFHQGPKASSCLHNEAGYSTASVPIRAFFKSPLMWRAGPYMTRPQNRSPSIVRSPGLVAPSVPTGLFKRGRHLPISCSDGSTRASIPRFC